MFYALIFFVLVSLFSSAAFHHVQPFVNPPIVWHQVGDK